MQYRKFGKLDWEVSALGLGIAELPSLSENEVINIVRAAIDSGVNFLDIGWPPAAKNNERLSAALDKALTDGYRQKIKIAASVPPSIINTVPDFDRAVDNLLKWLRADSVDFLLLGGLDRFTWPRLQSLGILKSAEKALIEKKAGYLGFFFHDQYEFLRQIIQSYDNWSLCRFQYSFMDLKHHPGYNGLKYAADNGLGVVAASPLLGGRLVRNIPETVASVWSKAKPQRPPAGWALRWVWNHEEVSTVVCDMNSVEQVKENAALADAAPADSLSVMEEIVIGKARDAYGALKPLPCTACRGCMPCPQNIDVPRIFEIYNDAVMYGDAATARSLYRLENHNIDDCTECSVCAQACGFNYPIPEWLKKARTLLEDNR